MGDESELTLVMRAKDLASKSVHGLSGSLGGLHSAAGKAGGGLKNLGGGIANAGKTAAFAAVGGIAVLAGALGFATKQAADEETGIKKMDAALKANVKGWNGNTDAIEATIAKREKLAFSDDDLRASMSILVTRFHDVGKASSLQATAMDLARLKGVDLETASGMLGKALSGNKKVLKDLGIQLPKNATQTQILAAIQKASAGQAEAYGKTSKGAMEAFQIAAGDLVEDIGGVFLPVMTGAFKFLTDTGIPAVRGVIAAITGWVTQNQPLINQITSFVGGALSAAGSFIGGTLIPAIGKVAAAIGDWFKQNQPLIGQVSGFASGLLPMLGQAFDVLTGTVIPAVAKAFSWISENILPPLRAVFESFVTNILPTLSLAFNTVAGIVRDNWPTISAIVGMVAAVVKTAVEAISAVLRAVFPVIASVAKVAFPILATAAGVLLGVIKTVFAAIGVVWNVAWDVAKTVVGGIGSAWNGLTGVIRKVWDGITGIIKGAANLIIGLVNGIIRAIDSIHFGIGPIDVGPVHFDGMQFKGFNIPQIPYLAKGGIVRQPTIAMVGESGPEAVLPLSRAGGGFGGTPVEIPVILDGREVARVVDRRLYLALQSAGGSGGNR